MTFVYFKNKKIKIFKYYFIYFFSRIQISTIARLKKSVNKAVFDKLAVYSFEMIKGELFKYHRSDLT